MLMSKTIDVFGGTGYIGSNFCKAYPEITHIHCRDDNKPILNNILYFISTTDNYNVLNNIYIDVETNITKLLKVLENSNNDKIIFNFVSSWFVYGETDLPAKESACCNPKGFYSITKKCAEDLLISFCKTYKINYRILRLANVYGNNDKSVSKRKNALTYLISKIKNNEDIDLYFNGNFVRDYIHVNDVCRAIKICLDIGDTNTIYNIGNGEPIIFKDIIDYIVLKTNSSSNITPIDQPDFHKIVQVKDMYMDTTKLNLLGYKKQINIFQGVDAILNSL